MNESAAVSGDLFREAMSRVAAQVHIVTTSGEAGMSGVTATAVTSVSDSPPSLLVCLNRDSMTLGRIRTNGVFGVSVLSAGHEAVARVFAGEGGLTGAQRFRRDDGWIMDGRAPLLAESLAAFVCVPADFTEVGSHAVLVGRVLSAAAGPDLPPLLYQRRRYWGS